MGLKSGEGPGFLWPGAEAIPGGDGVFCSTAGVWVGGWEQDLQGSEGEQVLFPDCGLTFRISQKVCRATVFTRAGTCFLGPGAEKGGIIPS